MRPGSANWPGPRMVSLRSFEGDFGIFPRSPAQVIWGPSTTIAAFSSTRSPSNRPSTSNTVRIATQYRPAMPGALIERLRARGFVPPDYDGGSLLNVAVTVLDLVGARDDTDPPPLRALDPAMREGVRQVVVVLADGLGTAQLRALCAAGDTPFVASLLARAEARDGAQLIEATTIFPSTTAAAITTLNTARTPQEHGNIAYFIWLEEFAQVTQMLRWGPGVNRRGSYFDDQRIDPRDYVKVGSVHGRIRQRGGASWVIELIGDRELRDLLRNPIAGEPRLAFLHTDKADRVKQHLERRYPNTFFLFDRDEAIDAGLFGRGDPEVARRRIGEVCAMLGDDRAASIVKVDGQIFRHRGSHGGMSPEEMNIPVLVWRA